MRDMIIKDILLATKGNLLKGDANNQVNNIVIDSRKANADTMYVSIIGENLDGHIFIKSAYDNGCRMFLVNKNNEIEIPMEDIALISVEDTQLAMGDIANFYKKRFNIPYIGVTGSVGKTTTRDMVASALTGKLNTHKNVGNLNNHLGVPLTLFELNDEHETAVIEMGMSHFKEIEYLADMVYPNIAIISNIGLSHVENLGSQQGVLEAKMEITKNFDKNNVLVINGDDEYLSTLKNGNYDYKIRTFGFKPDNDIFCKSYTVNETDLTFIFNVDGVENEMYVPAIGEHNILNAMSAILVGLELGLSIEDIQNGLRGYKSTKMRLDIIKNDDITIINDCYNASPDSMNSALKVLGRYKDRRVAILGDMFEMGNMSEYGHRRVGKSAIDNCDILITIGKDSNFISEEASDLGFNKSNIYHFNTKEEAIFNLKDIIKINDVVLVKASRGMKLEDIVSELI